MNRGSQFTVRLPLAAVESKPAPILDRMTVSDSTDRPRRRVLVADDNIDSAAMLTAVLELAGHDVLTTYDGAAALEAASSFKPDVAILDIGMPRVNGYDVAREMRARLGDRLLLIAMTGWGQAEDKRLAADAGFNHHLTKPVEISSLYKLLQ